MGLIFLWRPRAKTLLATRNPALVGRYTYFSRTYIICKVVWRIYMYKAHNMTVVYRIYLPQGALYLFWSRTCKRPYFMYIYLRVCASSFIHTHNTIYTIYILLLSCMRYRHVWSIWKTERRSRSFRRSGFFLLIFLLYYAQYCTGFILSNPRAKAAANGLFVHYIIQYYHIKYTYMIAVFTRVRITIVIII
jgi:hypothetical protein